MAARVTAGIRSRPMIPHPPWPRKIPVGDPPGSFHLDTAWIGSERQQLFYVNKVTHGLPVGEPILGPELSPSDVPKAGSPLRKCG
jgi:hypothetical protein